MKNNKPTEFSVGQLVGQLQTNDFQKTVLKCLEFSFQNNQATNQSRAGIKTT